MVRSLVGVPQYARQAWETGEAYKSQRTPWAKEVAQDEDFYMGKHWTANELYQMRLKGMAPLKIDQISPLIQQEIAVFTSKRPSFRAIPKEDGDVKIAALWSDVIEYIWQQSNGDVEFQQCIEDYFVKGVGYLMVQIDPYADDGRGEVRLIRVPIWDVYPDPNSRKIDLSDARHIFISRIIPKSSLAFNYPDKRGMIYGTANEVGSMIDKEDGNAMPDDNTSGYGFSQADYQYMDPNDDNTRVLEDYEKIKVPYWKIMDPQTGMINVVRGDQYDPKIQLPMGSRAIKIWRTRVRVTAYVGQPGASRTLYRFILPTDTYPIVPFFLHHNDSPFVQGDVSKAKDMQRERNKRRSIMIHNATLQGNFRVLGQKGAFYDKKKWEETGTRAGEILEYHQGFERPEALQTGQLPAGFFQLEQEVKGDIEYALNVFAPMMGSPADAPETYRGLLALEEAGARKLKFKAQHANAALRVLGHVTFQYAQALYKFPKIMRIAGENNMDYKDIYINQLQRDNIVGGMRKVNDVSIGKYDIVVVDATTMPTNRMALLNLYLEMHAQGIIDKIEVLKKTDVVDREGVIERMGEMQQLSAQVAALGEEVKDLSGLNQTLRRELQQREVQIVALKGSEGVKDELRQTQMEQRLTRARLADSLKVFNDELELEKKKLKVQGMGAAQNFQAKSIAALATAKASAKTGSK